jgi:hypothetical protein
MLLELIHNLSKEDAESLPVDLDVPVQGTLDELRKRVKEKWKVLETYLSQYIMSVVTAANILGYDVPECGLGDRLVQNIHPKVRSQLDFCTSRLPLRSCMRLRAK